VLAAGHCHEGTLVAAEHRVVVDGLLGLVPAQAEEVLGAEVGVVAPDVDDGRLAAHPALHVAPPEMTGRISTTSAPPSTASPGMRVPSLMTSTGSRLSSRRLRSAATLIGP